MALSLADLKKKIAAANPPAPATVTVPVIVVDTIVHQTTINIATVNAEIAKLPSKLGFELQEKVTSLTALILDKHPKMPVLLREIHTVLREQPENVTLMSEEEIAIIVDGLKVQTGVEFASSAIKGTGQKSMASKVKQLGLGAF